MFHYLEQILQEFRTCFTRKGAFKWFVIVIIGLIVRQDHLGVTSIIRELSLDPRWYESLIHFFRSTAWSTKKLRSCWYRFLSANAPVYKVKGRTVLAGDGVKQSKEGYYMPGVKKMLQESETQSKGEFIFGHLFGAVGVLIGRRAQKFCLPLKVNIQDGIRTAAEWENSTISEESHILQMIRNGVEAAASFGKSVLLLDRYFLSVPALQLLNDLNAEHEDELLTIVTKAKKNCTAYLPPESKEKGKRGRPRKKGTSVKLVSLFDDTKIKFRKAKVTAYGEKKEVEYYCTDLLWGIKHYQKLRFVLVKWDGIFSILVTTDLTLPATTVIELYAWRAKIESMFREMKQQIGGFSYHFWTKAMPKLNHYMRREAPDPLSQVTDSNDQKRILACIRATEAFVTCSTIAMGIVQLISMKEYGNGSIRKIRYLRTPSKTKPSEGTVMYFFRRNLFSMLLQHPDSFVTRFIRERQSETSGSIMDDIA